MPLTIPSIDDRSFQQLLDAALARIPSHNPEWTNFNPSDPGVTILEVFAFLTETLLYRANQIPERNRRKFLSLLGIGLAPATAARGIAQVLNERGPAEPVALSSNLELRAGEVPFRTRRGFDALPVEGRLFYKRLQSEVSDDVQRYYDELYATARDPAEPSPTLRAYETVPFADRGADAVDLGDSNVHGSSLWMALLARPTERGVGARDTVRRSLAGRVLSVGVVPIVRDRQAVLRPDDRRDSDRVRLDFQLPVLEVDTSTTPATVRRPGGSPSYQTLDSTPVGEVWREPGIIEVQLPALASEIGIWNDLEPLEAGVGDHPPDLEDSALAERLITWIKITPSGAARVELQWMGINCVPVTQRVEVIDEVLPPGSGEADQETTLARAPVLPGSLSLTVTDPEDTAASLAPWRVVDDLYAAGPEIPVLDPRLPPGVVSPSFASADANVFELDPEAARIRFGDGLRGRRPPRGARLRASYAWSVGRAGNVGAGAITKAVGLPPGFRVTNPAPTYGGANAEVVTDGERRIVRELRHQNRAVSAEDFAEIALRTPGTDIGRVDVLSAWHPDLGGSEPGDVPGAVTLMLVPRYDTAHPDTPEADTKLLDAVACWLQPRRLVTTEIILRGASYQNLWLSVGFEPAQGVSLTEVREAIARAIRQFLSPLPPRADERRINPVRPGLEGGYPLRRTLFRLELVAEVARVPGVSLVRGLLLAGPTGSEAEQVELVALELPRVAALSIAVGDPVPTASLRGASASVSAPRVVPVPAIPEEC